MTRAMLWKLAAGLALVGGCGPGSAGGADETDGAATSDGETTAGPDTVGDGDPSSGDGDGDSSSGDGDGDGDPSSGDGDPEPVCGDGVLDPGEQCDDGNDVDDDACHDDCTWALEPLCAADHPELVLAGREAWPPGDPDGELLCDRLDAASPSPDWVGPGWYQSGPGWSEVLPWDSPPPDYGCGGMAGGYQVTLPPGPGDGVIDVEICFAFADDPCAWSVEAQQLYCNDRYLWNLPEVPDCALRYCMVYVEAP